MLDRFELKENNTTVSTEFFGGLSSFLASFYIIIVNPTMLSLAGLPYSAVSTGTIMIAAISTIMMGLYANNPIILAPGMGMNAFFTFTVILGKQIPPDIALGVVFWSGVIFLLLSVLKTREKIISFIPAYIRSAITCGIGLFIAFIGFQKGGLIEANPATLIHMAPLNPMNITFLLALFVTGFLVYKNIRGSLVIGILFTLLLSYPLGRYWGEATMINWQGFVALPDFSGFGQINFKDSFTLALLPTMLAFMFTDMFDTISTLMGVFEAGNLLDKDGQPRNMKKSLIVDAIATAFSGIFGTSPTTSYIESAAGVQQGARTGLSSVFAGLMFLPFLFLSPLLSMFPVYTTAPILVIVGLFMMASLTKIDWHRLDIALPAFLAMILIPLTFSITHGLVIGLVCHYVMVLLRKVLK